MATSVQLLYTHQRGRCFYCTMQMLPLNEAGATKQTNSTPTFDHIILKSNGGTANVYNGVCACRTCNQLRGDMNFDVFNSIVTSITSRTKLKRQRHQLKKSAKWLELYPRCTLKPSDIVSIKYQPTTQMLTAKKKKPKQQHKVHILAKQGGRCACCGTFTLDVNREYTDMTAKEYTSSPFRPFKYQRQIICGLCFDKRKDVKVSRLSKLLIYIKQVILTSS